MVPPTVWLVLLAWISPNLVFSVELLMMEQTKQEQKVVYADDAKERVSFLLGLRLPWLLVGLIGGTLASVIVSRFETVLSENISLAFFLPLIVYMSDAVGTQTETIFVRNLAKGKISLTTYLLKEFLVGIVLGVVFGILIGLIANFWIGSFKIAFTVGLAMFVNVAIAPIIALIVPTAIFKEHRDPALGAGPFTTIVQDIISILIYFLVAGFILFS